MDLPQRGLGRCVCSFWLAVAFDIFGLIVLLIGVFANVFYYDFLIYAGAIVIFLSLIWWVFWYTGNIEVPKADLEEDGPGQLCARGYNHKPQQPEQVAVPMTTVTPLQDHPRSAFAVVSCDIQMQHTATETSPT